MTTTAPVARFLRHLPEPIAAEMLRAISEAVARDPISGPGIRCLLPGLAWRLEAHGCRLVFGLVAGEPMIVTAHLLARQPPRRRPHRHR